MESEKYQELFRCYDQLKAAIREYTKARSILLEMGITIFLPAEKVVSSEASG